MKDLVSSYGTSVVALIASMSVVWTIFRIHDFPWTGLLWASLAFSAAILVRTRSNRSITQVIEDVEAESLRAIPAPVRVGTPRPRAIL